jgi:hypothetical protein
MVGEQYVLPKSRSFAVQSLESARATSTDCSLTGTFENVHASTAHLQIRFTVVRFISQLSEKNALKISKSLVRFFREARFSSPMVDGQDPFELLGIARDAAQPEIRAAYLRLAKRWHPDGHPPETQAVAEQEFKKVTEAYERCEQLRQRAGVRSDWGNKQFRTGSRSTYTPGRGFREAEAEAYWRAFRRATPTSDTTSFASDAFRKKQVTETGLGSWLHLLRRTGLAWRRMHQGAHAASLAGALLLGTGLFVAGRAINFLWEKRNASHSFEHMMRERVSRSRDAR